MNEHTTTNTATFRPFNPIHNRETLNALASEIREHAQMIEMAAEALEMLSGGRSVAVNHGKAVEKGLSAIKLFVGDIKKKIVQKKFVDPSESESVKSRTVIAPTKKPGRKTKP